MFTFILEFRRKLSANTLEKYKDEAETNPEIAKLLRGRRNRTFEDLQDDKYRNIVGDVVTDLVNRGDSYVTSSNFENEEEDYDSTTGIPIVRIHDGIHSFMPSDVARRVAQQPNVQRLAKSNAHKKYLEDFAKNNTQVLQNYNPNEIDIPYDLMNRLNEGIELYVQPGQEALSRQGVRHEEDTIGRASEKIIKNAPRTIYPNDSTRQRALRNIMGNYGHSYLVDDPTGFIDYDDYYGFYQRLFNPKSRKKLPISDKSFYASMDKKNYIDQLRRGTDVMRAIKGLRSLGVPISEIRRLKTGI